VRHIASGEAHAHRVPGPEMFTCDGGKLYRRADLDRTSQLLRRAPLLSPPQLRSSRATCCNPSRQSWCDN